MAILKPNNEVDVPVELGDVHCTYANILVNDIVSH